MKKVLSVGEATIDSFLFLSSANAHCSVDTKKCEFCIQYASKTLADRLEFSVGGNAANASVGFKRLGFLSQVFTVVGNDWIGQRVLEVLNKEGVSLEYIDKEEGGTSYASVLVFQGERNIIVYHVPRSYHLPKFNPVDLVYLTSMGKNFHHAYEQMMRYIDQYRPLVSFNPGSHQLLSGLETLKPYLKRTTTFFLNKEEATDLVNLPRGSKIKTVIEKLYDTGPKTVVVTDGANGAYSFDGEELYHLDIFPLELVDTTGAGDSFASGYSSAILHGQDNLSAMRWGMANSASVVGQVGAQKGLLSYQSIQEILNDHPKIQPKIFR